MSDNSGPHPSDMQLPDNFSNAFKELNNNILSKERKTSIPLG